jgi:hypothetical protein
VRTRFYVSAALILLLGLSAVIYSQQGSATPPTRSPGNRFPDPQRQLRARRVTPTVVKGDVAEALSVIQENYIDGKKLEYKLIFKSSINGMLKVLDPHSKLSRCRRFAEFQN